MVNAAKNCKTVPAPTFDLARGMNSARLFNLYDAGEPIDDVVISAEAIESMLEVPVVSVSSPAAQPA
jgi:hypothetical protein